MTKISEAGRKVRFEQWEVYGADRLKSDLTTDPYARVGAKPVQDLAWEFVRMKEAQQAAAQKKPPEAVILKPSIYGVGVDLKEVARRIWGYLKK
jgi:hypothetical protein